MPEAPVAPPPKAPDVPPPAPTPPLPGVASVPAEVSAPAPIKGIDTSWIKGFFGKKEPVTEATVSSTAVVPAVASETRKAPEVIDLEPKVHSADEKLPKYPKEGGDAETINSGRFNRNGEHIGPESMTYYLHLGKNVERSPDIIGLTAFRIARPEDHYIIAEPRGWEVNPNGDKGLVVLEQRGNQLFVRTGDGKEHAYDGEFFKDNMLTVDMDNAVALGIEGFDPDTRAIQISRRNRNEFTPPIPIPDRPAIIDQTTWGQKARDAAERMLVTLVPGLLVGQPIPPVDITPPPAIVEPAPVDRGTPVAMPEDTTRTAAPVTSSTPSWEGGSTPKVDRPATGEISDKPLFDLVPGGEATQKFTRELKEGNSLEGDFQYQVLRFEHSEIIDAEKALGTERLPDNHPLVVENLPKLKANPAYKPALEEFRKSVIDLDLITAGDNDHDRLAPGNNSYAMKDLPGNIYSKALAREALKGLAQKAPGA